MLTFAIIVSPITSTSPASKYVGINQTIAYGDANVVVLPNSAGITDTGTTLLLLATGASAFLFLPFFCSFVHAVVLDAFNVYQNLTGAVMDNNTGLLRVTPQQFGNMRSLVFTIGGVSSSRHPPSSTIV